MNAIAGLNDRAQLLLKNIVERYIDDGQPVGSKTLAAEATIGLGAASIRSIMAELEGKGYLFSPHTSAGRIPTTQGFRLFVDHLVCVNPPDNRQVEVLQKEVGTDGSTTGLIESVSGILAQFSHMASIVQVPNPVFATLRHVDFLALGGNRVLVILVTGDSDVQNRVVETKRIYTPSELERVANYLNMECAGQTLEQARQVLQNELTKVHGEVNAIMSAIIDLGHRYAQDARTDADIVVKGESNLLSPSADSDQLRALFDAFHEKSKILTLLDECIQAGGVEIFIGAESEYDFIADCSLITAPYEQEGQVIGVLGVIGPTRMDYQRVIPIVEISAKILSSALKRSRPAP